MEHGVKRINIMIIFFELRGLFNGNGKIYDRVYQMGIRIEPFGQTFHRFFIPLEKFPQIFKWNPTGGYYNIPRIFY